MADKTQVFCTPEEWNTYKKKYCKDTRYHKCYITDPTDFPCIGIAETVPKGDLGQITTIEVFVYRHEFSLDLNY